MPHGTPPPGYSLSSCLPTRSRRRGWAHSIVGAAEVLYVVFGGDGTLLDFLGSFLAPAVLGNTVGGVVLVALLNYSQTRDRHIPDRDCRVLELE